MKFAKVMDLPMDQLGEYVNEMEDFPASIAAEIENAGILDKQFSLGEDIFQQLLASSGTEKNDLLISEEDKGGFMKMLNNHFAKAIKGRMGVFPSVLQLHFLGFITSDFAFTRYPD
jgi:hypothetical protein